jgi:2-oxoglutarate ferredoxin oxidoreductase subunit alpha
VCLKAEAVGLAVMTELPLVVIDIQRGGPSTGLPTKTEQADLLQVLFGRNGECPVGVVAAATPSDCFTLTIEAARLALTHRVPVFVLSDGFIANGAEPWLLPDPDKIPPIKVEFATDPNGFRPYKRDPETLGRAWALPGTPGLEHRIGGLEKQDGTGNISYDPDNHQHMVKLRAEKIARMKVPDAEVVGPQSGDILLLGWGCTYGASPDRRRAAAQGRGRRVRLGVPGALHEPLPEEPGGHPQALQEGPRARAEPRAAPAPRAREVPRRRRGREQGRGPSLPGQRARQDRPPTS